MNKTINLTGIVWENKDIIPSLDFDYIVKDICNQWYDQVDTIDFMAFYGLLYVLICFFENRLSKYDLRLYKVFCEKSVIGKIYIDTKISTILKDVVIGTMIIRSFVLWGIIRLRLGM